MPLIATMWPIISMPPAASTSSSMEKASWFTAPPPRCSIQARGPQAWQAIG